LPDAEVVAARADGVKNAAHRFGCGRVAADQAQRVAACGLVAGAGDRHFNKTQALRGQAFYQRRNAVGVAGADADCGQCGRVGWNSCKQGIAGCFRLFGIEYGQHQGAAGPRQFIQ